MQQNLLSWRDFFITGSMHAIAALCGDTPCLPLYGTNTPTPPEGELGPGPDQGILPCLLVDVPRAHSTAVHKLPHVLLDFFIVPGLLAGVRLDHDTVYSRSRPRALQQSGDVNHGAFNAMEGGIAGWQCIRTGEQKQVGKAMYGHT